MKIVQGMYENVQRCVRVGVGLSDAFEVKVGEYQGSVLSPLLFLIMLDAFSREIERFQLTESGALLTDALDQSNYRGLKLTEQAMKVTERIA